jgi:putative membrane protein
MKSLRLILVVAISLGACHRGSDKNDATTGKSASRGSQRDTTHKAVYQEADAVGIMRALDSAEIATSAVARDASQNDEVRSYAVVMIKDHSDIMHLVDSLGVAARDNAVSAKIRTDADSIARGLGTIAVGLNNTYIEEQVKAHQQALQLLDTAIIPSAQNAQLKNLLMQLRPTILAHYQRAVQILAARHKYAEENGEAWVSGLQNTARPPEVQQPAPTEPYQPQPPAPKPQPRPVDTTTAPPPLTTTGQ